MVSEPPFRKAGQLLQGIGPADEHLRMMSTPDAASCSSFLQGTSQAASDAGLLSNSNTAVNGKQLLKQRAP